MPTEQRRGALSYMHIAVARHAHESQRSILVQALLELAHHTRVVYEAITALRRQVHDAEHDRERGAGQH